MRSWRNALHLFLMESREGQPGLVSLCAVVNFPHRLSLGGLLGLHLVPEHLHLSYRQPVCHLIYDITRHFRPTL